MNYVDGPRTQTDPLLAPQPRAPPVPGSPASRPRPAPLVPLLELTPAILYDV
jgi:hypothetical protein